MQKYCIIPQQGNVFWQLVQGMALDEAQKKLLRACLIKHVEISLKTNSWEMLLQTRQLIPQELLQEAGDYIQQKCHINGVTFYQDVVDLEESVDKVWKKLVQRTANGNPTVRHLLLRAKRRVDGSLLILEVHGGLSGEILRAHSVPLMLKKSLEELLGYGIDVECQEIGRAHV